MSHEGEIADLFLRLGIALGLGLLVGLQRERAHQGVVAGFRTFALVSVTGALCGRLSLDVGGWVLAAGVLALAAFFVAGYLAKTRANATDTGLTTEVAALLMFTVGAFAALGPPVVAVAVGGATAALLQWKEELHGLAARIGDDDIRAAMQFAVISMVVLPVLPNRAMGPYGVLNPRQVWWMVVLIVGLTLLGYVGYKLLGRGAGTLLAGILGGIVSSTATTVAFARRTKQEQVAVPLAAAVALVSSAVVYARVLVELGVVWPPLLAVASLPMLIMLLLLGFIAATVARWQAGGEHEPPPQGNPSNLSTALLFGALYAVVLLAAAWAKDVLGGAGLAAVAGISGLVSMNAITLSIAQLARVGRVPADLAWRLVLLASISNLLFKAVLVGIWGSQGMLRRVLVWWMVVAIVGLALLLAWPGPAAFVPMR